MNLPAIAIPQHCRKHAPIQYPWVERDKCERNTLSEDVSTERGSNPGPLVESEELSPIDHNDNGGPNMHIFFFFYENQMQINTFALIFSVIICRYFMYVRDV